MNAQILRRPAGFHAPLTCGCFRDVFASLLNVSSWPMVLKNSLESARLVAMLEVKAFEREKRG
jgi:hypothetical protein